MRTPGKGPAPLTLKSVDDGDIVRETRTYRFLTYVMGGGVKVKDHEKFRDERTPIRVASIRGQLRFWWRASNPSNCVNFKSLRQKESEIWGSTDMPSSVVLRVIRQPDDAMSKAVYEHINRPQPNGPPKEVMEICSGMKEIAYGAFPLQPKIKRGVKPGVLHDYGTSTFELRLQYPKEFEGDIRVALWAWETFGGLGGRTRRGFGAIECIDRSQSIGDIRAQLEKFKGPKMEGVPLLSDAALGVAGGPPKETAIEAWKHCLEVMHRLRQGDLGRNQGKSRGRPGRSKWPEPDTIRHSTGNTHRDHKDRLVHVNAFPRARFGLPIIFHFKDGPGKEKRTDCDPADCTLKPIGFDRMASPLILRPIRDGNKYRAMALKLWTTMPPGGIELVTDKGIKDASEEVTPAQADTIKPLAGKTNPVDRFLEELKKS